MIDVSEFNGAIDWQRVPAVKVLVRVTYGASGVDTRGAENLRGARAAGTVGGYHFLEDHAAQLEVENLLAHYTPRIGELRAMIDVEPSEFSHPTAERVLGAVAAYLERTGHRPIIYGSHDVLEALALPVAIAACPLMLAGYGPNDGLEHPPGPAPHPWTSIAAHQYTSVGSVPGVPSHCDLSHVYDHAALLVPRPRILDRYRLTYVDREGRITSGLTRSPGLWICRHPRAKRRGRITVTPYRKD